MDSGFTVYGGSSGGGGGGGSASSLTVAAFDAETANGTANPQGRGLVYLTDGVYTCVWNGTAWEYYYGSMKCVPMIDSQFSWINQDSASVSTAGKAVTLRRAPGGADALRMRVKSIGLAPPYQVTAIVLFDFSNENFAGGGIWIGESGATPKMLLNSPGMNTTGNTGIAIRGYRFSSPTSFSGTNDYSMWRISVTGHPVWLRIRDDGTNIIRYASLSGVAWHQMHSMARLSYLVNVSQWGIGINTVSATACDVVMTVLSWKEEQL